MTGVATFDGVFPRADDLIALRALALGPARRQAAQPARSAAALPGGRIGLARGRGLDFAELRACQAGDDVRDIDWRRTARHGQPCTRVYQEERGRSVRLVVDLSPGMQFGTRVAFKSVTAARAASLLAWAAADAGDLVGALVWHGGEWAEAPPRARHAGAIELIRLLSTRPRADARPPAGFAAGLQRLTRPLRSSDQVTVFSDFRQLDAAAEALLLQIGRRAACRLVHVHDPFEATAPPPGIYALTDGQRDIVLDFADKAVRRRHVDAFAAHSERLARLAVRAGARLVTLATDMQPAGIIQALS